MKNLIQIAKIVTKKKVKKIEIFDDQVLKTKNSKFNEFYEALSSGKFKNDRDAAAALYKCSPKHAKYRQLKSRFKKRLLNTLFFLDVNKPSADNYDRAYFNCNKEWALVKILLSNRADDTAASLARHILTVSLHFRFADLIVNSVRILRNHAAQNGNLKDFEKYDDYIKHYSGTLEAEIQSEKMYQYVILNYYKPLSDNTELAENIKTYCQDLLELSDKYESPIINYDMYLVWAMRFEMFRDYESLQEICIAAVNYIEENPHYYQEEKMLAFYTKQMSAFLHLKDYRKGKTSAEKCLNKLPDGSESWFAFMEYYLLLALHTGQFIQAVAIFNQAVEHPGYKKLDSLEKEKWNIYQGYMTYFSEKFNFKVGISPKKKSTSFKVNPFLSEPVDYPKELRNFAILMQILKVLLQLQRKNYPELEIQIEKLKNFSYRQLKKEEHFRAIQFIRLLQQLSKASYQLDELRNTEKYLQRLKDQPFLYRGAVAELEIIPYEQLWELVLDHFR